MIDQSSATIDAAKLRYELVRRALSQRAFAAEAGIPEETLCRALAGRGVRPWTLRAIAETLERIPPIGAIDLVITGAVS